MTASIITSAGRVGARHPFGPFAGIRALVRKDVREWVRSRRIWVILVISSAFMALTAANAWIISRIAAALPPGEVAAPPVVSLAPADNLIAAVSSQIFVLAAIFVAGSLIARERESGTLAWVASKPVTRASIWASKWVLATAMLTIVGVAAPVALTVAVVTLLYGAPPVELALGIAVGVAAVVAFFAALGLAVGTVLPGQAPAIAATFGIFALMPIVAGISPIPIEAYLPTSIMAWPAAALSGAAVPWVTPVSWLVVTVALAAGAIWRMNRIEL